MKGEIIMSEMRNPITREENFSNPAGNVMMELQEADLNKFVAGAGETKIPVGFYVQVLQNVILVLC